MVRYILALCLAWLPFSFGKIEIGVVTFTSYILVMLALIPVALWNFLRRGRYSPLGLNDILIGVLCLAFLVSTLWSRRPMQTGYLAFHAIFIPVVSYVVIKGVMATKPYSRMPFNMMLFGFVIFCLFALVIFIKAGTSSRVLVFARDSIAVATFSVVPLLYVAFSGQWKRPPGFIAGFLAFGSLVGSLSRAYLVVLPLTPVLYWGIKKGYSVFLLIGFLLTTLLGTIVLIENVDVLSSYHWNPRLENSVERLTNLDYWKAGLFPRAVHFKESLEAFLASPVFGVGLRVSKGFGSTVHNVHLEWLEYGGLFGYMLFSIVFLAHFAFVAKQAMRDDLCAINVLIIFVILLNAMTNGFMHGVMPYVVFILMAFSELRVYSEKWKNIS